MVTNTGNFCLNEIKDKGLVEFRLSLSDGNPGYDTVDKRIPFLGCVKYQQIQRQRAPSRPNQHNKYRLQNYDL